MKTELRAVPHLVLPGQTVIELWHDGVFIGTVTGADGPGVRVVSKFLSARALVFDLGTEPPALEVSLAP